MKICKKCGTSGEFYKASERCRSCHKAYGKIYYQVNAEKLRERGRLQSKANRSKWDGARRDEINAYAKIWKLSNLEKVKSYARKHYIRQRSANPRKLIFKGYKSQAKKRNLEFTLTFEQFCYFWQRPCHYTGRPIRTIGLDRVDNTKGYILGNIVPCCAEVNSAKMAMSVSDFIQLCRDVVEKNAWRMLNENTSGIAK